MNVFGFLDPYSQQTDNHTSTPTALFYRADALPAA